jgi:hypothetical protein
MEEYFRGHSIWSPQIIGKSRNKKLNNMYFKIIKWYIYYGCVTKLSVEIFMTNQVFYRCSVSKSRLNKLVYTKKETK